MRNNRAFNAVKTVAIGAAVMMMGASAFAQSPKNVIFMIPDGCAQSVVTLARWFKGTDLEIDDMLAGHTTTHMANSVITGSAAAGTAFACGEKTTVRFLGIRPRLNDLLTTMPPQDPDKAYAPLASILEAAKSAGKSVGLVATSRITHATPAAFASHIADRGWDNDIMEHMVYQNMDVVLGGARRHLLPTSMGGRRTDGENLEQVLIDRGYSVVTTKDDMDAVTSGKLWGAFASSHMEADIDRQFFAPEQPSLADMTAKAIELLSQNPNGFFLMVEGSQVDWAGHANDAFYMVTDFLAFDDAVAEAKAFADGAGAGETLVAAFPDHNTGGMALGSDYAPVPYTATTVDDMIGPLQGMTMSAYGVARMIEEASVIATGDVRITPQTIQAGVQTHWGLPMTLSEALAVYDAVVDGSSLDYAIATYANQNYLAIGWTTHGHSAEDVPLWLHGMNPALAAGLIDNTEIPRAIAYLWGCDLAVLTDALYVNAMDAFPGEAVIDHSDPENPVLVIKGEVEMPFSKDYLVYDGVEYPTGGLTVYAPLRDGDDSDDGSIHTVVENRVYIPQAIVDAINLVLP